MSSRSPVISTIVPVFNAAGTLERTLRSLQRQTLQDWEAICIDDGSTDASNALMQEWAARDSRIRVIAGSRRGRNRGVSATRNIGLSIASGEFVHFLDSDDTVEPDAFETLTRMCRATGCAGAAGSYEVVDVDGMPLMLTQIEQQDIGLDDLIERVYLWTSQHIVRRTCFDDMGFDESYQTYEDLDVWLRLGERGVRWAVDRKQVASYFVRPGSLSRRALTMLPDAQRAWSGAFDRSRRGGTSIRLLDDSTGRCDRALHTAAISIASRAAMCFGEHGPDIATRLFDEAQGPRRMCAETLGRMGYYQVLLGLGVRPEAPGEGARDWRGRLETWWSRCQDRGWLDASGRRHATEVLDMLTIGHDAIAKEIVRMAQRQAAPGLEIIGFGRNGRLLAQCAREAGLRVRARDDQARDAAELDVQLVEASAIFAEGWLAVISPLNDDGLAQRHPGALRWREVPSRVLRSAERTRSSGARVSIAQGGR